MSIRSFINDSVIIFSVSLPLKVVGNLKLKEAFNLVYIIHLESNIL